MSEPFGGYNYELIDLIPEECPCVVCKLVQKEPYQVTCCGKILCKSCLDQLISNKIRCPNCSNTLSHKRSFPDLNTDRKIKHLKIYCVNKKNGCEWTGHLKDLDAHITECPKEMVYCPNKCDLVRISGERIQRHQLENHMKMECKYRIATCVHCGVEDTHFFIIVRHARECPDMTVPCSNRGCDKHIKRKSLKEHAKTCPKAIVCCQYSSVGCTAQLTRENAKTHNQEYMEEHLGKAVATLQGVMKQLKNVTAQLERLGLETENVTDMTYF